MEKIIIYNVADARKIITMAANMRIKSIVIDNTKLSDTLENVLAYSQDYRTDDIMPFINKDKSIVILHRNIWTSFYLVSEITILMSITRLLWLRLTGRGHWIKYYIIWRLKTKTKGDNYGDYSRYRSNI